MALVNSRGLLRDARANGYAVGAFNVENMEMMQAVIAAAEAEHAPVILQTTPSTLKYAEPAVFAAMARAMAGKASVPVAMHLDHGDRFGLCQQAASDGYTSLMIDGSKLPLDENIALARRVVEMASRMSSRPCVEAELGKLGGKEDDLEVKPGEDLYTDPGEAARFVRETGIDSLAVAIGTAHGFYKGKPRLAFERLTQIREAVDIPWCSMAPPVSRTKMCSVRYPWVCVRSTSPRSFGPPIPRRYGTVWLMTPRSTIPRNMGAPRGRPSSL